MSEFDAVSGPGAVSEPDAVSAVAGAAEHAFRVANEEW
jgi:hypothetical protein